MHSTWALRGCTCAQPRPRTFPSAEAISGESPASSKLLGVGAQAVPQEELRYSGELFLLTSLTVLTRCWSSRVGGGSTGKERFPS